MQSLAERVQQHPAVSLVNCLVLLEYPLREPMLPSLHQHVPHHHCSTLPWSALWNYDMVLLAVGSHLGSLAAMPCKPGPSMPSGVSISKWAN